jgi:hypothetical protein
MPARREDHIPIPDPEPAELAEIENGITIPPDVNILHPRIRSRKKKYHFDKLEVGQSYCIPYKGKGASGYVHNAKRMMPTFNFIYRVAYKNGVKGIRIWRIA